MAGVVEAMESGEIGQDQPDHDLDRRANRIMKIFGQIAECLDDQKVASIKETLSEVIKLCKNTNEKPIEELNKIYLKYLLMVEFRAGISVNLIKLSIQSFLMIEDDPEALGEKVNDMYLEMILTEHPTLAMDMHLSDELLKTYFRLLSEGSEPALHMRLMIVGMFGVGKTSLVRRLCGKNIEDVEDTEGIDIFTETCEVSENDGDWIISPDEEKERIYNLRLQNLLDMYKKEEKRQSPQEIRNVTEQTGTDQSQNTQDREVFHVDKQEIERKVTFIEFREKVSEKDLRERAALQTLREVIRRPTVSIWDFAGQSVYYSTHHFFLNDRSIYLLVLDLSKELNALVEEDTKSMYLPNFMIGNRSKLTCLEAFKFWMKSIYIYTQQKETQSSPDGRPKYIPKIVLIGTHKDAITPEQLNGKSYEQYKDDYFERALKCFTDRPIADLVHKKKFLVNNKAPSADELLEFLAVKREVFSIAEKETLFLNEPIPAKFLPLERAVFRSKREKKNLMRFDDLQEENKRLEFPSSESHIKLFLAFQHAFGNVIYFNAEPLHEIVILTPQWIINVFKAFISHKPDKEVSKAWYDLKERGILREELILRILEPDTDLCERKDQIVKFMEHMDFLVKPFNFKSNMDETHNVSATLQNSPSICQTIDNFYILPCMLPPIPESEELKNCYQLADGEYMTTTLCFYFKECFLPPFVTHCILASFVKKMPIRTLKGKPILYNGLGSFSIQNRNDRYLTLWSFDDILHIKISFIDVQDSKGKTQFCISWRNSIEQLVLDIFNFHGKNVYTHDNASTLFEYRVKCPKCEEQMPFEHKIENDYICKTLNVLDLKVRKHEVIKCSSCGNSTAAKEMLEDWFELGQDTKDVVLMDACLLQLPQDDRLADLSEEIPKKSIKRLAVELCIKDTHIERLEEDRTPSVCFNYRVLNLWKKRGEKWHIMYEAISKAGINIRDEDFFRIIKGEENEDTLKLLEKTMKQHEDIVAGINLDGKMLVRLAECIGEEFWLLGVRLGIADTKIQTMMVDLGECNKVCLEILKRWKKQADPETGLKVLIHAMIKSGTDMSEVHKVLNMPAT